MQDASKDTPCMRRGCLWGNEVKRVVKPMRDAFSQRTDRFRLLEQGIRRCGWGCGVHLLEVGCATGEAAAYVAEQFGPRVTGVDTDPAAIRTANQAASGLCGFLCADACALPFQDACFDGLYCEAAFAPLAEKERAVAEYARVLRPGALVLMNDFAIRFDDSDLQRTGVADIPCFQGVRTMAAYREIFERYGFMPVCAEEDAPEFIRIVLRMSRIYGVAPSELGGFLLETFSCPAGAEAKQADRLEFFSKARLTYCQMLFQKGGGIHGGG